jgi:lipopolysaccharide transport system ATP-binding protein
MTSIIPTVFHITHWKAGSQWVAEILKQSASERFVPWKISDPKAMRGYGMPDFYIEPVQRGKIYGTVYLKRDRFQKVVHGLFWRSTDWTFFYPRRLLSNWWHFGIRKSPIRCFVVIRDLRDTLISLYFSTKKSHDLIVERLSRIRQRLDSENEEDGLIYLMHQVLHESAAIQSSWLGSPNVLLLRYEDILGNEHTFFEKLVEYCQINIHRERLQDIIQYNLFEVVTGRKRGEQDVNAHLRRGIAGDWRNYFTGRVKAEFKKQYGKLLIDTGYEKDLNW